MTEVRQETIAFLQSQKDVIDTILGMSVYHEQLINRVYGELACMFEKIEDERGFNSIRLWASYIASDLKMTRPGRPVDELANCGLHVILFEVDDVDIVDALGIIVDNTSNHAVDTYGLTTEQIKSLKIHHSSSFN